MSHLILDSRFEGLVLRAQGAMGSVYRAWDRRTRQPVAVKVPSVLAVHRFWREAGVLAQMEHPHIVRYVDRGRAHNGFPWLAMEWLEGEDLEGRLARGRLSVEETLALAQPIASALAWAHARGFIHRDLKPSNLFLCCGEVPRVKLLDFGLARATRGEALTCTGMFMGTFEYIAPEQATDAKRASSRSDVFSFGAVLFHCLTGMAPFDDGARKNARWIPSVSAFRQDVPPGLADLVARMLARTPAERPPHGTAIAHALAALADDTRDDWEAPTDVMPDASDARARIYTPPPSSESQATHGPSGTVVMRMPRRARR